MYRLSDQATYQYQYHQWKSRDVQAIWPSKPISINITNGKAGMYWLSGCTGWCTGYLISGSTGYLIKQPCQYQYHQCQQWKSRDVQAIWPSSLSVSTSPMEKQGCTGYLTKQPISINITNGKVGMYRLSDQATYQYQHHQWVSRDVQAIWPSNLSVSTSPMEK